MKRKTLLFLLSLVAGISFSFAGVLENGKVYRFANVGKEGNYLALSGAVEGAVGSPFNAKDLKQQWYVVADDDAEGYYLRNALNGAYLKSPRQIYVQWPVVFTEDPDQESMLMSVMPYEDNYVIKASSQSGGYSFAHNDGSNNIVCWVSSSAPTQWNIEEVEMTEDEMAEMLDRFRNTGDEIAKASRYENNLDALFSDKACTKLKVSQESLNSNTDYLSLPPVLKRMVDKAAAGDWSEENGDWDSAHALKYRVQSYEPYSEGSAAAGMAGIQAYTNMNNPTGIVADSGEILYIMVDDDVPEGATLYIGAVPDCNMYNNTTSGTRLKKGLNMIMCNSDLTHYFIYYTVNTVKDKMPLYSLKDFEPVTIHIEGGRVNGFFNYIGDELYSADTKEDFEYTVARAVHPMYDLVGKYVILHFFLEDTPNTPAESVNQICVRNAFNKERNPNLKHDDPVITMKAWDDMCFSERILMGIQSKEDIAKDYNEGMYASITGEKHGVGEYIIEPSFEYSDYFNNRMMGITLQASGLYMNATAWRTAYAPGTVSAILSQFPEDGIWGPAHEYGHINQTPMRIAGTTEESNNVFSNVANYYLCKTTSRCDYPSAQLQNYINGKTYLENGTWGTTRMFWQLWCYYHATGHNTRFYPRLYELLRKYPLKRDLTTIPGKLNPKTDMLHFAKMCCVAAGEDLTDFFTTWGFFVPLDDYYIDDYDRYYCVLTQEDIDEVKSEIASWGLPVNDAIIFIDDRPGSSLPAGFGYKKELCGELGGLNDFKDNIKAEGDFSFNIEGQSVKVEGEGKPGVGFLVTDVDGEIIGFSNSFEFTLTAEAIDALLSGRASIVAIGADNSSLAVTNTIRDASVEKKKELLENLIADCRDLLSKKDYTLTHVGKLIPEACKNLEEVLEEAESLLQESEDGTELTDSYILLSSLYNELSGDPNARIKPEDGASYMIVNNYYQAKVLSANEEKLIVGKLPAEDEEIPSSIQWVINIIPKNGTNVYHLVNSENGKYIKTTKRQSTEIPLGENPQEYSLVSLGDDVFSFAPDNQQAFGLHIDAYNNVVQWNTSALASQWKLIKTKDNDESTGIEGIFDNVFEGNEGPESYLLNVFDVNGRLICRGVSEDYLNNLDKGVYIIVRKNRANKVVIR